MLNELSQASRATGNANNGHLDGAGDLMFDMSQLSQLEPIRGLESSLGRYELDSSKDSSRNVGKKRKAGDMSLSSSLEVSLIHFFLNWVLLMTHYHHDHFLYFTQRGKRQRTILKQTPEMLKQKSHIHFILLLSPNNLLLE